MAPAGTLFRRLVTPTAGTDGPAVMAAIPGAHPIPAVVALDGGDNLRAGRRRASSLRRRTPQRRPSCTRTEDATPQARDRRLSGWQPPIWLSFAFSYRSL